MDRRRFPHPSIFLPWLVAAFSLLWLKRDLLLGNPASGPAARTLAADMASFRMDVLLLFGVIPLILYLLFYFLPRPLRLPLMTTACVLLEIVVYAEGRSFVLLGQFASPSMLFSAISWVENGSGAQDYLPLTGVVKLSIALCAVFLSAFAAHRMARGNYPQHSRLRQSILVGYLAVTILASIVCWISPMPGTPLTTSIATILVKTCLDLDTIDQPIAGLQSASLEELIARYRQLAQAPVSNRNPKYWGKAKNANVIFFVMETGPARYLDLAGDLNEYPNFARFRDHSVVGERHHSTFPVTNRAYISLFSSLYPVGKKSFHSFPQQKLPGVISILQNAGYETGAYGPLWTGESDQNMLSSIGFDTLGVPPGGINDGNEPWQQKVDVDRASLQMLESDIERWNGGGKRFAVAFLPQIGHGPWPDMSGGSSPQSVAERGRALMRLQDAWLGELLQALEKDRLLSNTIIVLTADHGIRDTVEDPSFTPGMIDEYSYHVPFMVYSQTAIPNRVDIPWLTSHIDISPTVLDLLGVENGRMMEEGVPIWQDGIRDRTTFFLASHYLGCDGYYRNQKFYMVKYLSNTAYESPKLQFDAQPIPGPEANQVSQLTTDLDAVQSAMFLKFSVDAEGSPYK
jgi:glucan phosphoethanolaminetransferase (alkaline phosphatase superfamily)